MKKHLIALLALCALPLLFTGCATEGVPTRNSSVPVYDVITPDNSGGPSASQVNALQQQLNP